MPGETFQSNERKNILNEFLDIPGISATSPWRKPFNVVFRVGPQRNRFYCHKEVVKANSNLFARRLKNVKEAVVIDVPDVSKEAFNTVVRHLYNNDLAVKHIYLGATMVTANRFQFSSLEKDLLIYAKERTNSLNAIPLLKQLQNFSIADGTSVSQLKEMALSEIDKCGINALKNDDFNSLEVDSLIEIFKKDTFNVPELTLISMSILWAKQRCGTLCMVDSAQNIRKILKKSFRFLRFPSLKVEDILFVIKSNFIITKEEYEIILKVIFEKTGKNISFIGTGRAAFGFCLKRFKREELKITNHSKITNHQIDVKVSKRIRLMAIGVYIPKYIDEIEGYFLIEFEVYHSASMHRLVSFTKRSPFDSINSRNILYFVFTNSLYMEAHTCYSLVLNIRFLGEQKSKKIITMVTGKGAVNVIKTCIGKMKVTWRFGAPKMKLGIYSHQSNKSILFNGQFPEIIYDFI